MSYLMSAIPGRHHTQLMERAWAATAHGGHVVVHDFMLDDDRCGPLSAAQWFFAYLPTTAGAVSFTGADVAGLVESVGFIAANVEELIPGLTKVIVATKPAGVGHE
jgi:2-hydroxy-4-(methylsulfanyl)butanoate S-methyltransferase